MTPSELFQGEKNNKPNDEQIIELLERIQRLENQKNTIFGMLLIILGIACFCISQLFSGSDFKDFMSGLFMGISCIEMLAGVFISTRSISKK